MDIWEAGKRYGRLRSWLIVAICVLCAAWYVIQNGVEFLLHLVK